MLLESSDVVVNRLRHPCMACAALRFGEATPDDNNLLPECLGRLLPFLKQ